ncbi:alpha/beta hydrolase [Teredinibacter sp. KSP-S5-2]|uniref:alpha/beta hydrolase n=1 Tax=Teredinibacter sp. KSP-S5-2 TaxID=3034506 RepID=UPI0029341312|nr:alpha/beta hydrolase [Teredinibacter sp. KSP-S5-2]WNO10213.1 alpha/beta hydrolase [Teredinibacter sp. KSP-S5-2]
MRKYKQILINIFVFQFALFTATNVFAEEEQKHEVKDECVILLHGLARSSKSLTPIEKELSEIGYRVINQGYPSTQKTIELLSDKTVSTALEKCGTVKSIHFVTHSMGGILVRYYLKYHTIENLGHVVMLGPPNKGSQVVDKLKDVPGFKLINGPAGLQLGTGELSIPNQLGPANFDLGIIAGNKSINLILSSILPNEDDGKVTVENTKLEGMQDHLTLPVSHPLMMRDPEVIKHIIHFLQHGYFNEE